MKARFGAQVETHPTVVRGFFDFAGHQAVFGDGFIQALHGQGVIDQRQVIRRHALADVRVEAIEAAHGRFTEGAALGSVGVDVVKMLEVGGVFGRLVVEGQRMLRGGLRRGAQQQAGEQSSTQRHHWAFSEAFSHHALKPRL